MDGVSGARGYKYKPGIGSCGDVSSHGRWAAGQGGEGGAVLVCALTCARQAPPGRQFRVHILGSYA